MNTQRRNTPRKRSAPKNEPEKSQMEFPSSLESGPTPAEPHAPGAESEPPSPFEPISATPESAPPDSSPPVIEAGAEAPLEPVASSLPGEGSPQIPPMDCVEESSPSEESGQLPSGPWNSSPDVPTPNEPVATVPETNIVQRAATDSSAIVPPSEDPPRDHVADAELRPRREFQPGSGLLGRPPLRQERLRERRRRAVLAAGAVLLIAGALGVAIFLRFSPSRPDARRTDPGRDRDTAVRSATPEQPAEASPPASQPPAASTAQNPATNEALAPATIPPAAPAAAEAALRRPEPPGQTAAEPAAPAATGPVQLRKPGERWINSLGMEFMAVGDTSPGATPELLFSVWETRVKDYEAFCAAIGRTRERALYEASDTHPVVKVTWHEAREFCDWLTEKESNEGMLGRGEQYRLPTDEEWSMAVGLPKESGKTPEARDGKTKDRFPWGTSWPPPKSAGNFADVSAKRERSTIIDGYKDGFPQSSPVGSFQLNRYGLHDMGGNVWEWCLDSYRSGSPRRVMRGGSWADDRRQELSSSYRNSVNPEARELIYGFRCVLVSTKREGEEVKR